MQVLLDLMGKIGEERGGKSKVQVSKLCNRALAVPYMLCITWADRGLCPCCLRPTACPTCAPYPLRSFASEAQVA